MAYKGYLIKVGDYKIPLGKIKAESYKVVRNVQDLDSYRDADGKLHRTTLEHSPNKVEFETPAMFTNEELSELLGNIEKNYTAKKERKASVTLYVPETNSYATQDMYMPDPEISIYLASEKLIKYNSVRIAFIGY